MVDEYFIVIPAYNPDYAFVDFLLALKSVAGVRIVVVNDGTDKSRSSVFDDVKNNPEFIYLENHINLGKGAALKNAFNYLLVKYTNLKGIVTADADGQHSIRDIYAVLEKLRENNKLFILGARKFNKNVPLRSKLGNTVSNYIYRIVLGQKYKDTQTGLRGIPKNLIERSLTIKSNRYEFETEQLAVASELKLEHLNVDIETIYLDGNSSSNFNPVFDSMRIYFALFRYAGVAIITAITDFFSYITVLLMYQNIWLANASGRAVTIILQYYFLRKFVFRTEGGVIKFMLFVLYVVVVGILSSSAQYSLVFNFEISKVLSKILVDGVLFILNFLFLRDIVFTHNAQRD